MNIRRTILAVAFTLLAALGAGAQTENPLKTTGEGFSTRAARSERSKMIGTTIDTKTLPIQNTKYQDERLKQLEKEMKERNWGSESTAWKEASEADNISSYRRYVAMYPHGEHSPEANKRLIDLQVNEAFNSQHNSLPGLKRTVEDDDSPTSTIVVENGTGMPLTVYYSGADSKSVTIRPGDKTPVTLKNGQYKIAAEVTSPSVRPYAGGETFRGGTYEVCFIIVHR